MREFFTSKTFIAICVITVLLLGMMTISSVERGKVTVFEDFVGIVITPIQSIVTTLARKSGDFVAVFSEYNDLKEQNQKLKEEINVLSGQLRDAQKYVLENEELKSALGIKTESPDYKFCSAVVVASEQSGYSYMVSLN